MNESFKTSEGGRREVISPPEPFTAQAGPLAAPVRSAPGRAIRPQSITGHPRRSGKCLVGKDSDAVS